MNRPDTWPCHAGAYAGKQVIVVDGDIDVSNHEELIWAMLTRSDLATSIDIITNTWSTPLDPRIPPEEKAQQHQVARHHRCLPSHPLAREVRQGEHAQPRSGAPRDGKVRLSAAAGYRALTVPPSPQV